MVVLLSDLRKKLDKFKLWANESRVYIAEELDYIKNLIDVKAETYLKILNEDQTNSEAEIKTGSDKINAHRKQMIYEVETYEKNIFATLTSNELETKYAEKLASSIKKYESTLEELTNASHNEYTRDELDNLANALEESIYEYDCKIRHKSSLLFLTVEEINKCFNYSPHPDRNKKQEELPTPTAFGCLFVLNDYVCKESFE